jgi:hypothetical protein
MAKNNMAIFTYHTPQPNPLLVGCPMICHLHNHTLAPLTVLLPLPDAFQHLAISHHTDTNSD